MTATMPFHQQKPLPALTGIRIFAALYVVLLHTGSSFFHRHGAPDILNHLLGKGSIAVSLFFILSGFILAYIYDGKLGAHAQIFQFWEARFARIYPVYFLSLALMLPLSWRMPLPDSLAVLGMVQTWIPGKHALWGAWNFPAWSLSVEAFFYLCFPMLLPLLAKLNARKLQYLAALLLLCCAVLDLARPFERWATASHLVRLIPLPILRLPEFVAGMALGMFFLRVPQWKHSGLVSVLATLATFGILILPDLRWTSFAVLPFGLLVLSLAYQVGPLAWLLSTRILVLLGGASYAVYLLQLPVRSYTRIVVEKIMQSPRELDAYLSPCILLLVSVAIFLYWEEPARKYVRRALGLRSQWKWPNFPSPKAGGN